MIDKNKNFTLVFVQSSFHGVFSFCSKCLDNPMRSFSLTSLLFPVLWGISKLPYIFCCCERREKPEQVQKQHLGKRIKS
jgi:hypothetical protein